MEGLDNVPATPQEAPPPIDVAAIMASATPDTGAPLSGPISNPDGSPANGTIPPSNTGNSPVDFGGAPPKQKRQYRRKDKTPEVDPLWLAVEQAQFGKIAVMAERMFFKACEAEDMSAEEAGALEHSTGVIMYHLMKQAKDPKEVLPWAAFIAAASFPIAARIVPISKATEGFWKGAWNWVSDTSTKVFNFVAEKLKRPQPKAA